MGGFRRFTLDIPRATSAADLHRPSAARLALAAMPIGKLHAAME